MCLVCAVAVLALPVGAAAKPGYYVFKPQRAMGIYLHVSHGYRMQVFAAPGGGVELIAFKFGSGASASYSVHGHVNAERISANFGRFGRISVRFQPKGPPETEQVYGKGCKGRPPTRQEGTYVGSIRFRGKNGFVSVHDSSAKGTVFRSYRVVCRIGRRSKHQRLLQKGYSLSAVSKDHPTAPVLTVFKEDPHPHRRLHWSSEEANFSATSTEHRGRITITLNASTAAEPETFAVEPLGADPTSATVTPPAPFTGSAHFEQLANGESSWVGDLAVGLPGVGTVPLTGGDYQADLCRGFKCACLYSHCGFIAVGGRPQLMEPRIQMRRPWLRHLP